MTSQTAKRSKTVRQTDALERIKIVIDLRRKRLLAEYPDCTPSEWVTVAELVRVYLLHRGEINALVAKGWLELRQSDIGEGPEVRAAK